MNKLFPAAAAAAILALTGCGGGSTTAAATPAAETTKAAFTTDQSCDQLFDKGDEGRLFAAVNFLGNVPDTVKPSDQTKAKILAVDLEYVAGTANDQIKPHVETMAKTLTYFSAATGEKVTVDVNPFKAAGTKVLELCPKQETAYNDGKEVKAAVKKAEADIAARNAEEAAAAKAAEEAAKAPKEYSGAGDDVVTITKHGTGAQVAVITHAGWSNFAVHTLDKTMDSTDLLVNTIGNYTGTVLFDARSRDGETTALKITADGPWTVKFIPLTSVRSFDGSKPMTGLGDDVFAYTGTAKAATFTHDGSRNIAVHSYGTRSDLLVNEIGPYTGTVVWTPGFYTVTADGNWSATLK
ncbi:hypothetical protein QE394_001055 [Arthrobacter sp. SORGH_AS 212]|uniref:hypothetical protein n=1 Tax=Pseudarthrobacter sp. SORGH_AS 212 TaxID=3041777 RepID=UPI00278A99C6|nr:hypothetical protein [Arthrobacter sp. SORGH_AS_0212]